MKKFILLFVLVLTGTMGLGQYTFTGDGDGTSWNDPNNWNPTNIPLSTGFTGVSVTIPTGFTVNIPEGLELSFISNSIYGGGTVNNYGTFNILSNTIYKYFRDELIFNNYGTFNLGNGANTNYAFYINNNSKMVNKPSGIVVFNGVNLFQEGATTNIVFENQGIIQKKMETDKFINANMRNTGVIEVQSGTLTLNPVNSEFIGGTYNVFSSSALSFNGTHHFEGVLSGLVNGEMRFNTANIRIDDEKTATNNIDGNGILMTGASTVNGPGTFVNNKIFTINNSNDYKYLWSSLTFTNNSILNIGNGGNTSWKFYIHDDSKLINSTTGTVIINGKDMEQYGGTTNIVF
ncbi:MAG: hypothetical protein WCY63_11675, partial [Weeksellaceae bacterium]